jgi:hypothetical protein
MARFLFTVRIHFMISIMITAWGLPRCGGGLRPEEMGRGSAPEPAALRRAGRQLAGDDQTAYA